LNFRKMVRVLRHVLRKINDDLKGIFDGEHGVETCFLEIGSESLGL